MKHYEFFICISIDGNAFDLIVLNYLDSFANANAHFSIRFLRTEWKRAHAYLCVFLFMWAYVCTCECLFYTKCTEMNWCSRISNFFSSTSITLVSYLENVNFIWKQNGCSDFSIRFLLFICQFYIMRNKKNNNTTEKKQKENHHITKHPDSRINIYLFHFICSACINKCMVW